MNTDLLELPALLDTAGDADLCSLGQPGRSDNFDSCCCCWYSYSANSRWMVVHRLDWTMGVSMMMGDCTSLYLKVVFLCKIEFMIYDAALSFEQRCVAWKVEVTRLPHAMITQKPVIERTKGERENQDGTCRIGVYDLGFT